MQEGSSHYSSHCISLEVERECKRGVATTRLTTLGNMCAHLHRIDAHPYNHRSLLYVSFAKETYLFYRSLLQKRPMISRSLLVCAHLYRIDAHQETCID